MVTVHNLRSVAATYPNIQEATTSTNFRAITFKVKSKGIIGVEKDMIHATFALNKKDAQSILADRDLAAEAITKSGNLIGIRVSLNALTSAKLNDLVAKSLASTQ